MVGIAENVRVGPAGWSYPDWTGVFYPRSKALGFDALAFVASYFSLVEINSTFYRIPKTSMCRSWVERTQAREDFRLTAKAFHRFTHGAGAPEAGEVAAYRHALEPIADAGRLSAILLQFPWSFKDSSASRGRIEALRDALAPLPLALEVRHGSWSRDEGRGFLESCGLSVCAIDQPVIGDSIEPGYFVEGAAGVYVRLHGRNYRNWFTEKAGRDQRYDYLYSRRELSPWVEMVKRVAARGQPVSVVLNNHFRGQAPANAFEIMAMLTGERVRVPRQLRATYRQLEDVTEPEKDPNVADGWLFDSLPSEDDQQD